MFVILLEVINMLFWMRWEEILELETNILDLEILLVDLAFQEIPKLY